MLPIVCLWAGVLLLHPNAERTHFDQYRVQSSVICEVKADIVPEGIRLRHRTITATIPVPRDGKFHMVIYDFRDEQAEVSLMSTVPVKREKGGGF